MIAKCDAAWWAGLRKFYGLPNGVSTVTLRLLFPRVALLERVFCAKFRLLHHGSSRLDTLLPEAVICDRGFLLPRHRRGYSQITRDWCQFFRVDGVFEAGNMAGVRATLAEFSEVRKRSDWEQFAGMSSTAFAADLFVHPSAFYSTVLKASRSGLLGVCVTLLAVTGSLTVSYLRSRNCGCGVKFSFQHFLSCSVLGPDRSPSLRLAIECQDWREAAGIIVFQFMVFIHAFCGGDLSPEESDLFSLISHPPRMTSNYLGHLNHPSR